MTEVRLSATAMVWQQVAENLETWHGGAAGFARLIHSRVDDLVENCQGGTDVAITVPAAAVDDFNEVTDDLDLEGEFEEVG